MMLTISDDENRIDHNEKKIVLTKMRYMGFISSAHVNLKDFLCNEAFIHSVASLTFPKHTTL